MKHGFRKLFLPCLALASTVFNVLDPQRTLKNTILLSLEYLGSSSNNVSQQERWIKGMAMDVGETAISKSMNRTAVVWAAIDVSTPCDLIRLQHLVDTAGMDVWVLHAHYVLKAKGLHDQAKKSMERIRSVQGLFYEAQHREGFLPFDESAGSSKSSFLRFLASHPEYDYAWIVENDMLYTGPWQDLFLSEMNRDTSTDFLTAGYHLQKGNGWWYARPGSCTMYRKVCSDIDPDILQVYWFFARVSSRLARSLMKDLSDGHIKGHHEAVIGAFCNAKGFSLRMMDPAKLGDLRAGHTDIKEDSNMTLLFLTQPGKLIHPVRCSAVRSDNMEILIQNHK